MNNLENKNRMKEVEDNLFKEIEPLCYTMDLDGFKINHSIIEGALNQGFSEVKTIVSDSKRELDEMTNQMELSKDELGWFHRFTFGLFAKDKYKQYNNLKADVETLESTYNHLMYKEKAIVDNANEMFKNSVNKFLDSQLEKDSEFVKLLDKEDELIENDSRLFKIRRLEEDLVQIKDVLEYVDDALVEIDEAQDAQDFERFNQDSSYAEYNSDSETREANYAIRELNSKVREFGGYIQASEADTYWGFDNSFLDYLERDSLDNAEDDVQRIGEQFSKLRREVEDDLRIVQESYNKDLDKVQSSIQEKRIELKKNLLA